jgi:hypothetical protein
MGSFGNFSYQRPATSGQRLSVFGLSILKSVLQHQASRVGIKTIQLLSPIRGFMKEKDLLSGGSRRPATVL